MEAIQLILQLVLAAAQAFSDKASQALPASKNVAVSRSSSCFLSTVQDKKEENITIQIFCRTRFNHCERSRVQESSRMMDVGSHVQRVDVMASHWPALFRTIRKPPAQLLTTAPLPCNKVPRKSPTEPYTPRSHTRLRKWAPDS